MSETWKRGWVHFWCGDTGWKISPVLWTCVGGPDSVSSREKVEDIYAVVSLSCFEVGMLALKWFSRPTRVEDFGCVGIVVMHTKLFPRRARAGAVCQGKRDPLQFYSVDFTAESNGNYLSFESSLGVGSSVADGCASALLSLSGSPSSS